MKNKNIKRRRNMSYFIDATSKIIDEEGIELVTIRKVADLAGYNSATLYNYFENLDELILYASVGHLKDYISNLTKYLEYATNSIDIYCKIWNCFLKYSFLNPEIYNNTFFGRHNASLDNVIEDYYSIFPEELENQPKDILPMLLISNLYERNLALLLKIQSDGYLNMEDLDCINQMSILLYQGMLTKIINSGKDFSVEDATETTLRYIKQILTSFINKAAMT